MIEYYIGNICTENLCNKFRPLFKSFNQLIGCPKTNFGPINLFDQEVARSFVISLGPKVWPRTSVRCKTGTFRCRVDALIHCVHYSQSIQETFFEVIYFEIESSEFSKNLISFLFPTAVFFDCNETQIKNRLARTKCLFTN